MCVKKIYFNTYADGAQDVTEQVHACREGKMCPNPEVRTFERKLSFNKGDLEPEPPRRLRPSSYYLGGDLPTPRRSKSPSPGYRRESEVGPSDSPKPSRYRDRHDHREPHRRSSRHLDLDRAPPSPSKLKRTNTAPHLVVIEQGAPVFSSRDLPPGPIHVAEGHGVHRHSSRRHRDRDSDDLRSPRLDSANPKAFVIVNDEREHRRRTREGKRRMSSSSTRPDPALITPPAEEHSSEPREPRRRYSLRRANTVVLPSTESSPPNKHLRWEDEVRIARERQNDEISKRKKPLEVHQDSGLKGILKPAPAAPSPPTRGKPFTRQDSDLGGLRRAVETLDLPTADMTDAEELKLYDRDRLLARFGGSDEGERSRRRRGGTKVWTGDRYQYL
ncbi:hypothetical protein B0T16DRAFT_463202 [Cercophora newfieldiana]|uniref:Uncharacterized protein n=1 Tax=Cercophora newfieldiana TaxID=92897 RepID=A0AA39XSX2_9PEZI|nr:hypothetical protein B0T16DRAFT_463202 [Cercophora newfieldiana]